MKADAQTEREVLASLDRMTEAYTKGDIDGAVRQLASDDDVTVIEPGPDEEYVGHQQIRAGAERDWNSSEGELPINFKRRWVSVGPSGDVAWVSGENEVDVNVNGQQMKIESRFTGIAVKQDGEWRWHTMHYSLPHPEQEVGSSWPKGHVVPVRPEGGPR